MASEIVLLENISADLELMKRKKIRLQKEWKDFESQLVFTQHSFKKCLNDLDLLRQERLEQEKMDWISKEKEFHALHESYMNDLNMKDEKLAAQQKLVDEIFGKFQVEQNEVENIRNCVERGLGEIKLKEERLVKRSEELDLKEKELEEREKRVDLKEKEMESIKILSEERLKELEIKEKLLGSIRKLVGEPAEKRLRDGSKKPAKQVEGRNNKNISEQKRTILLSSGRKWIIPSHFDWTNKKMRTDFGRVDDVRTSMG